MTLAIAESLTGGLAASRVVNVPGSSEWFKGGVVAYDSQVKFDVLDVPEGPVVSEAAAKAMADGVRRAARRRRRDLDDRRRGPGRAGRAAAGHRVARRGGRRRRGGPAPASPGRSRSGPSAQRDQPDGSPASQAAGRRLISLDLPGRHRARIDLGHGRPRVLLGSRVPVGVADVALGGERDPGAPDGRRLEVHLAPDGQQGT